MAPDPKQTLLASVEKTYGRRLRRYLAARLRNARADTPDLLQEIYLRLLRIDDFDTIRYPQAYLHTIASHVLQQHTLKQGRLPEPVDVEASAAEFTAETLDPAAEVEAEQSFEALERSLKALSPRLYTTLVLNRCHGVTLQQIATELGVSRGQVKKYLVKALIHMREQMHLPKKGFK